ncbi:MAG TPA: DUF4333 domain-containing protein [Kofleriaceae bacterium]
MRTLAALAFIAGVAAVAIGLARTPTVADGRVLAADLREKVRKDGANVTEMECDREIPIGVRGATFTCIATLPDGETQVVDWALTPDGQYEARPQPPTRGPRPRLRKPAPGDPWAERP